MTRTGGGKGTRSPIERCAFCDSSKHEVDKLKGVAPHQDPLEGEAYFDLLADKASLVDVWETAYFHVLSGDAPVAEWFSSTGLMPCLTVLPKSEHAAFLADYAARTRRAYPPHRDGSVILVLPRLFVLAVRK